MSKRSPIVHVEWRSRDVKRLKEFYRAAFRWKFKEGMPGYLLAATGGSGIAAGFMQIDAGSQLQAGMLSFISAEDLDRTESAIREAGGQVIASAQAIPGWGRFSLFTDPDGNQLALWQSEAAAHKAAKKARKHAEKSDEVRARETAESDRALAKEKRRAEKAMEKLQPSPTPVLVKGDKTKKKSAVVPGAESDVQASNGKKHGKKKDKKKHKKDKKQDGALGSDTR